MRDEQQDFQGAIPAAMAEQAAQSAAAVDQPEIHVVAADRIDHGSSILSGWDGKPALASPHGADPGKIGGGSIERLGEFLNKLRVSDAIRASVIGGALVVAFGLGWACASIFNSTPDASLMSSSRMVDPWLGKLDSERHVRNHRLATLATPSTPLSAEPSKPKPFVSVASAHPILSAAAHVRAEPQGTPAQTMPEKTSAPAAPSDANPQAPLSPVPETKPATIAGWTVRDVYGDRATLVGPDRIWTVRTGDTVPGVGRIDTIVRWGSRWIVATTTGLISTE